MNAEKIAIAVKTYLVTLAIADKLPLDLNELELDSLTEVIQSTEDDDNDIAYENAGHYLSDDELTITQMVEAIANHEDPSDLIENVEGVLVWEKVRGTFDCEEFLDLIGYKNL